MLIRPSDWENLIFLHPRLTAHAFPACFFTHPDTLRRRLTLVSALTAF
ncbi:hypothetical protein Pvag_1931 [Pantoea vagans C9-1]|nr:hypothetical protein Pvag_1931 [Pantoea vagans C9-1]